MGMACMIEHVDRVCKPNRKDRCEGTLKRVSDTVLISMHTTRKYEGKTPEDDRTRGLEGESEKSKTWEMTILKQTK